MSDSNYQNAEYWDNRYSSRPEPFDWLQTLPSLQTILFKYINKNDNILHIGCGNSRLPETLSDEGYENITNIDFSQKVIEQISKRYKKYYPKMKFKVMDILNMKEFEENSFEIVIDKGALDCILCGEKSKENFEKSLSEIYRILCPDGKYIMISFNTPLYIKKYLNEYDWLIEIFTIDKNKKGNISNYDSYSNLNNVHYIYIMTSQKKGEDKSLILNINKQKNLEKNVQLNPNIKKETNKNIINKKNENKNQEDNNNIQQMNIIVEKNKRANIIENKNNKNKKENDKLNFEKETKDLMKNDGSTTEQKINNLSKNSSSLKQNQNINNNEIKENLLVNENQCIKLEDKNLEKNVEIKPKFEKEIEKNEDNNINNNEIINEKNINIINSNLILNEKYSKENNNIIIDEKSVINNNIKKEINDVKYVKSNEKKCCKHCLIF